MSWSPTASPPRACPRPAAACTETSADLSTRGLLTIWDRVLSATLCYLYLCHSYLCHYYSYLCHSYLCYSYLCHSVPLYASTIQPHPGGGESEKSALCPCPSVSPELPTHSIPACIQLESESCGLTALIVTVAGRSLTRRWRGFPSSSLKRPPPARPTPTGPIRSSWKRRGRRRIGSSSVRVAAPN